MFTAIYLVSAIIAGISIIMYVDWIGFQISTLPNDERVVATAFITVMIALFIFLPVLNTFVAFRHLLRFASPR